MRIGTIRTCAVCKKEFYQVPSRQGAYCSPQCFGHTLKGKPPVWSKPPFVPQMGIQELPSGSRIYWDSVSPQLLRGNRWKKPSVRIICGDCRESRWVCLWNLRRQLQNPLYTGYCISCWRTKSWADKGRYRPDQRKAMSTGYIKLWRPGNPMADKRNEVFEHRLVMAEIIGRPLMRYEHVHHKNGVRSDNRPENLELIQAHHHPTICHMQERIDLLEALLQEHHIPVP